MNILIAEDMLGNQMIFEDIMDELGFDYDLASDGLEAVEFALKNKGKYDLGLMDIDMPNMDGMEATRIIREKCPFFPIMALSANEFIHNIRAHYNMDDCLQKPYRLEELHQKIDKLTVKKLLLEIMEQEVTLKEKIPMDQQELEELKRLDEKGLAKLSLLSPGDKFGYKFVVNKNLQNKISHDFIGEEKKVTEFLDHSEEEPGLIHLYANQTANKMYLLPDAYKEMAEKEGEELKGYTTLTSKETKD